MTDKRRHKPPAFLSKLFPSKRFHQPAGRDADPSTDLGGDPGRFDFSARDVLVGSFRNKEQYRINMAEKFYYTAKANLPADISGIRYIAACLHRDWQGASIPCYGKITKAEVRPRRLIPVPMARDNGEEPYLFFGIDEWHPLALPIDIAEGGVYAPQTTSLFLLQNCRYAFELFDIHSADEYRLSIALRSFCTDPSVNAQGGAKVKIDRFTLTLTEGSILLKEGRSQLTCIHLAEYIHSPKALYTTLVQYFRK